MSLIYKGQNLFIDNTSIKSIAKNNITPFYAYSYKKIRTYGIQQVPSNFNGFE